MFIEIEREQSGELAKQMNKSRESFANLLWNFSCCETIGYNRTMFEQQ